MDIWTIIQEIKWKAHQTLICLLDNSRCPTDKNSFDFPLTLWIHDESTFSFILFLDLLLFGTKQVVGVFLLKQPPAATRDGSARVWSSPAFALQCQNTNSRISLILMYTLIINTITYLNMSPDSVMLGCFTVKITIRKSIWWMSLPIWMMSLNELVLILASLGLRRSEIHLTPWLHPLPVLISSIICFFIHEELPA